jgi:hypothetical protein
VQLLLQKRSPVHGAGNEGLMCSFCSSVGLRQLSQSTCSHDIPWVLRKEAQHSARKKCSLMLLRKE